MFERFEPGPREMGHCTGTIPGGGRFTVYDQGAQITGWVPREGAPPVLFLSEKTLFQPRVAIRGGIPLSFPWFAKGRSDDKSPSHGFARLARWHLLDGQESNGVTTLRWKLDETMLAHMDGMNSDRNRFELTFIQKFGPDLTITLHTRNTDDVPLVIEQALHSYFHVGNAELAEVHGLGGTEYLDKLTGAHDTQVGPVTFAGEVDRIYWTSEPTEIHDLLLGRRIVIQTTNSHNTVVWNPWQENAAGLRDLGNDEWREFVCVETANVNNKAIRLSPGQAHDLTVTLSVAEL